MGRLKKRFVNDILIVQVLYSANGLISSLAADRKGEVKMKTAAGLLLFLMSIVICIPFAAGETAAETTEPYTYTIAGNTTATITGYTGSDMYLRIPDMLDGHPVSGIGDRAFRNNVDLVGVTVPEGVSSIGEQAFYGCASLADVILPSTLQRIGRLAFAYCGRLSSLWLPQKTDTIGDSAFEGCAGLSAAVINSADAELGSDVFWGVSSGFTLYAPAESSAQAYAQENAVNFLTSDLAPSGMEPAAAPWPIMELPRYSITVKDKGTDRLYSYNGPSQAYTEAGSFQSNAFTRAEGLWIDGDYLYVDMYYRGVGTLRTYFRTYNFRNLADVPQADFTEYPAVTTAETQALYGPSSSYLIIDNALLPSGTELSVYLEENGYAFAEFESADGLTRGWIDAGCVSPQ